MRESCTSGSERGKPCKGLTYLPNEIFNKIKNAPGYINNRAHPTSSPISQLRLQILR